MSIITDNTQPENNQPSETELDALLDLINGTRMAQGWSCYAPDEAIPIALVWFRSFKENSIEAAEYPLLLETAIKYRIDEIRNKKRPTPFSIELLIAMSPSGEYINPQTGRGLK